MAIRLVDTEITVAENLVGSGFTVFGGGAPIGMPLAGTDTLEEAEKTKRAFELVLAPRFTRDEAIAIVAKELHRPDKSLHGKKRAASRDYVQGIRLALEALAAAGAFVDEPRDHTSPFAPRECPTMADKLDAAGIR